MPHFEAYWKPQGKIKGQSNIKAWNKQEWMAIFRRDSQIVQVSKFLLYVSVNNNTTTYHADTLQGCSNPISITAHQPSFGFSTASILIHENATQKNASYHSAIWTFLAPAAFYKQYSLWQDATRDKFNHWLQLYQWWATDVDNADIISTRSKLQRE